MLPWARPIEHREQYPSCCETENVIRFGNVAAAALAADFMQEWSGKVRLLASNSKRLAHILSDAIADRGELLQPEDACVRVVAGAADDVPGLIVDRFGPLIVCTDYDPAGQGEALMAALETGFPGCRILLRWRCKAGDSALQLRWGGAPTPERIVAVEDGLRFEIGTDPRHDFGLFLDGRTARSRVRALASGALVLNLFSYACGFGIAARAGGARDVVNVDPERSYLSWGRRNAALNGTDFRVVPDTAQAFLRRWRRRAERGTAEHFDVVVADPPAFGVGRGDDRVLRKFWPELLESVAALAPAHAVLLCNDKAYRGYEDFEPTVQAALGKAYDVSAIRHGREILGREPSRRDPWYAPPRVLHARRT
jgi:23S rRNA (cytosine1962-C5)-methyltransferase